LTPPAGTNLSVGARQAARQTNDRGALTEIGARMSKPTVAILGASRDRRKYGNKSVRAHLQQGYEVFPVNPHAADVEGLKAFPDLASVPVKALDRISVYLPPETALGLLEEIQKRGAKEVWFNPGSDSPEVVARAEELGLEIIRACSIVDLGVSPGAF
jgi:predicted CoA-binding protein